MVEIFNEEKESLVTYYILPLIRLNFRAFGYHFLDCRLYRSMDAIQLTLMKGCKESYWEHPNYQHDYNVGGKVLVTFSLPAEFGDDILKFCEGKYSQMSDSAKNLIYKHSGLFYNKQIDKLVVTDMKLLALTKSQVLRDWIRDNYKLVFGNKLELIKLKDKESIYVERHVEQTK
jgi:hypothetical protein